MKKIIIRVLRFGLYGIFGKERLTRLLVKIAKIAGIDLLIAAYNSIGILNSSNADLSGERYFICDVLKSYIKHPIPILLDVGANVGKYTLELARVFPDAKIFSFEPNRNTFEILRKNVKDKSECFNEGLGAEKKSGKIYTYAEDITSSHASTYSEVFEVFHAAENIVSLDFDMITIDDFCTQRGIEDIDLLKIDTEGNELEVLKGSKRMLTEDRIKIIQFEFGECDVFSRVFLRDFYEILPNFRIYRLNSDSLISLFEYKSTNEIFRFQNFIAINISLVKV